MRTKIYDRKGVMNDRDMPWLVDLKYSTPCVRVDYYYPIQTYTGARYH